MTNRENGPLKPSTIGRRRFGAGQSQYMGTAHWTAESSHGTSPRSGHTKEGGEATRATICMDMEIYGWGN
jgi:hypothetical protein